MGGCDFHVRRAARTAEEAYRSLVEEALYESGHDPYNGTISTTSGFREVTPPAGEALDSFIERTLDAAADDDNRPGAKWGRAACVDLGPSSTGPGLREYLFFGWAVT